MGNAKLENGILMFGAPATSDGARMRLTVKGSDAEDLMVGPVKVSFIGKYQELGHNWSAALVHVPAGEFLPMHTHRSPELFHILEGDFLFATRDEDGNDLVVKATKGDSISIPSMMPHTWKGGDVDGIMLNCFESDLVDFFVEASIAQPTREEANRLAKKHGMEMLGPFPDVAPIN